MGQCKKLQPVWHGPFCVIAVLSPALYKIRDRKRDQVVHHDRLKLCEDRYVPLWMKWIQHHVLTMETKIPDKHSSGVSDLDASSTDSGDIVKGDSFTESQDSQTSSVKDSSFTDSNSLETDHIDKSSPIDKLKNLGKSLNLLFESGSETSSDPIESSTNQYSATGCSRRGREIKHPTKLNDYVP